MVFEKNYSLINAFPDFSQKGFDMENYNRRFQLANILISARSSNISYPEHWGPLSIKCAFNGTEYYKVNNCDYAVTADHFLVVNEGNYYSSHIDSDAEVRSFSINFSPLFVKEVIQSMRESDDTLLQNFDNYKNTDQLELVERLHLHDDQISPAIFQLALLSDDFNNNKNQIEELYIFLLEKLMLDQKNTAADVNSVSSVKHSTRVEIFKRLHRAKDFIDSFYMREITLTDIAKVCFLNQAYFLRQFKKYFSITPHQYLIKKRVEAAKKILEKNEHISITDVCNQVGYNDLSSFSKLFKHFYEVSPEKFQKNAWFTVKAERH